MVWGNNISQIKKKKPHIVYINSKGIQVPSCTTILNILNVPTLIGWANKIGRKGLDYYSEMASYGRIGTLTHCLIEKEIKGESPELIEASRNATDNEKAQAYKAFKNFLNWLDENNIKMIGSEMKLVSDKFNYGGTIDYYGEINGKLMIMDFKTSNYFNKKMFLQLAGYKNLLEENGYEVESVMILKLDKFKDEFLVKEKNSEELKEYFKLFKFCLATYKVDSKIEKEWEWR